MGVPDEESWLRTYYWPTGAARGWRRTGCIVMLLGALAVVLVVLVLTIAFADDDPTGAGPWSASS